MFRTMRARFAVMEPIATLRTGVEPARGIMVSHSGTRAFRRGGRGLVNNPDRPTFQIPALAMFFAAQPPRFSARQFQNFRCILALMVKKCLTQQHKPQT